MKAKPVIGGSVEGSKGVAAAAARAGSAVARTVAVPASTRSRNPSMDGAIRPGSRKVMKWLPSSMTISDCGTMRWCSSAAARGTRGSSVPCTMSIGPA